MKIYLVKGAVSDPSVYDEGASIGQTEWQFSDAPSGERGSSADYVDLASGLAAHADCVIDVREADFTADEEAIFHGRLAA